jgi:hypothetical protein
MNLGKAKKTIVQYGSKTIVYDSLCSWISIDSLELPNMYRFKIYTANDEGDLSTPVEIAMTPYTASDRDALGLSTPDVIQSTSSALVEWKSRLSSDLYDVYAYSYEYADRNGDIYSGSGEGDAVSFFVENVSPNTPVPVDITLKIVPLVAREPILDTVYRTFTATVTVNGTQPVIFLDKPELDAAFPQGFNSSAEAMAFSWRPVPEVSAYTLKISDSYYFPEGAQTFSVSLGNVDSYTLTGQDQMAVHTLSNNSSVVRPILFWTVVPTNGDANIITQRRQITGLRVLKLFYISGTQVSVATEEGGVYRITTTGDSPYIWTTNMNKVINPGASNSPGKLTFTFEYKADIGCTWQFWYGRPGSTAGIYATAWLPASDEWKEFVLDVGEDMTRYDWGKATDHRFRINLVDSQFSTSRIVYITNMQVNIY